MTGELLVRWIAASAVAMVLYLLSSGLSYVAMYRIGRRYPSRLASRFYAPLEWLARRSSGDIAERIDPRLWEEDWRIMSLPGRLETQRALVLDYRSHFARFGEIANYLDRWQPPALVLWGRHDVFFDLEETLSWMKALPRMEAHILDGPHFLLETRPNAPS